MIHFSKKIKHRLLLLLILSTLIPVSIVGWYGISSSAAALQTLALSHAESVASSGNSLKNISDDILCLRKYPPVQEMIRCREGNKVNRDTNSTYQI